MPTADPWHLATFGTPPGVRRPKPKPEPVHRAALTLVVDLALQCLTDRQRAVVDLLLLTDSPPSMTAAARTLGMDYRTVAADLAEAAAVLREVLTHEDLAAVARGARRLPARSPRPDLLALVRVRHGHRPRVSG